MTFETQRNYFNILTGLKHPFQRCIAWYCREYIGAHYVIEMVIDGQEQS